MLYIILHMRAHALVAAVAVLVIAIAVQRNDVWVWLPVPLWAAAGASTGALAAFVGSRCATIGTKGAAVDALPIQIVFGVIGALTTALAAVSVRAAVFAAPFKFNH